MRGSSRTTAFPVCRNWLCLERHLKEEMEFSTMVNPSEIETPEKIRISTLRAALSEIIAVIEAHEIESLSCDRDGEKYCECLRDLAQKAKLLL